MLHIEVVSIDILDFSQGRVDLQILADLIQKDAASSLLAVAVSIYVHQHDQIVRGLQTQQSLCVRFLRLEREGFPACPAYCLQKHFLALHAPYHAVALPRNRHLHAVPRRVLRKLHDLVYAAVVAKCEESAVGQQRSSGGSREVGGEVGD